MVGNGYEHWCRDLSITGMFMLSMRVRTSIGIGVSGR